MSDKGPGKAASEDEILDYVRAILGKRAIDIDEEIAKKDAKNMMADVIEQGYFDVDKNSRDEEDFPEAGIELKVTPLERKTSEPVVAPKERLALSMIDREEVKENSHWTDAKRLTKHNNTLIIWYLDIDGAEKKEYPYIWSHLWKPKENLIWREKIQRDYEIIKEKIEKGEKLSGSDTNFLAASTKDRGHKDVHNRAWSIKPRGMRQIFAFSTGLRLVTPGRIRSGAVEISKLEERIIKEKKDYSFRFDRFLSD